MLFKITEHAFVPVCASGGIRSLDDVYQLFDQGADKVALNSVLFEDEKLISKLANIFGSQSIVGSVEIKKIEEKRWEAFYHNGRERSHIDAFEWIKKIQSEGVGELFITSIDSEGMKKGFDLEFLENLHGKISVPLVLGGGFNNANDVNNCILRNKIDGVALAGFFHYGVGSIGELKKELKEKFNVCVREI